MAHSLTQRQRDLLQVLIHDYIINAEPVGSRSIAKKFGYALSPATIRNIMADLEDLGYLEQPHTSAGRIPTDKGYRFYVDSFLQVKKLSPEEERRIQLVYAGENQELEALMADTSRFISTLTEQVGLVMAPRAERTVFRRIELLQLHRERILVVMMTESSLVHHRIISISEIIPQEELNQISAYLNDLLQGQMLAEVREFIFRRMQEERALFDRQLDRALRLCRQIFSEEARGEIYYGGTANLFKQPEFTVRIERAKEILAALEEKNKILKILDACIKDDRLSIFIGSELSGQKMSGLSIIASPYHCGNQAMGILGVLGPTRMDYIKVATLVDYMAKLLSRILSPLEH